ncbi:MAG: acyloxyacyl hydrolase [Bacteroidales bacterium]|nr:acyloxyacyl hydrolase [Bacteroidales bacterium]
MFENAYIGCYVKIALILVAGLLSGGMTASAQTPDKVQNVGVQGRFSHILDGHGIYDQLLGSYNYGIYGATVGWNGDRDAFDRAWNNPGYGLGFSYARMGGLDFKNDSRLGDILNLYGWTEFDLLRTRSFRFGPLLELGLAFSGRTYDYHTNPYNRYIGSKVFALIGTGLRAEWLITPQWSLQAGVYLTHHSNGMLRAPNLGINEVSLGAGVRRYFAPTQFIVRGQRKEEERPEYRKGLSWNVFAAAGVHSCPVEMEAVIAAGGPAVGKAPAPARLRATAGVEAVWRYAPLFAGGLGFQADYAANNYAWTDRVLTGKEDPRGYSPLRLGLYLTQEFWYRKLSFHVVFGAYLYKRSGMTEDTGVLYEKIGLRYHFRRAGGLFAGLDMRAHQFDRSYCLEWSLGYNF